MHETVLYSTHWQTGISTCLRALANGCFFCLRAREMTETVFDVFTLLIDLLEVGAFARSLSLSLSCSLFFAFYFSSETILEALWNA